MLDSAPHLNSPLEERKGQGFPLGGDAISVVVISRLRVYRETFADALDKRSRCRVVATAANCEDALAVVELFRPAAAVIQLPVPEGPSLSAKLLVVSPGLGIVAVGVDEDEAQVAAWSNTRVCGCLGHEASVNDLEDATERAARGELTCSPSIARTLFASAQRLRELRAWPAPPLLSGRLTRRETEIVDLIRDGLTNREIAARLSLQNGTVKNHVHNILRKLEVRRRSDVMYPIPKRRGS